MGIDDQNEQVVRRIQQACGRIVLTCTEGAAKYCESPASKTSQTAEDLDLHRRNRLVVPRAIVRRS